MKRTFLMLVLVALALPGFSGQQWPNLDRLTDYPEPGRSCEMNGNASVGTDKAKSNGLKNRYRLPGNGNVETLTVQQMLALQPPNAANFGEAEHQTINHPNTKRYVSVTGYIRTVAPGGISFGESCNCGAKKVELGDTHIEMTKNKDDDITKGKNKFIVETTYRIRKLAKLGLLKSANLNGPANWSTQNLKQLIGKKVTVEGWLYYDPDHFFEDWSSDPQDKFKKDGRLRTPTDKTNWRQTCWEIHPVMGIKVN